MLENHNVNDISILGQSVSEAKKRLQAVGALVSCTHYSSKKGVYDADDIRVIRQRKIQENPLHVELICAPCRIAIRNTQKEVANESTK